MVQQDHPYYYQQPFKSSTIDICDEDTIMGAIQVYYWAISLDVKIVDDWLLHININQ